MKSTTAPSRAYPVVVFPLCRWCPPQETSQSHPSHSNRDEFRACKSNYNMQRYCMKLITDTNISSSLLVKEARRAYLSSQFKGHQTHWTPLQPNHQEQWHIAFSTSNNIFWQTPYQWSHQDHILHYKSLGFDSLYILTWGLQSRLYSSITCCSKSDCLINQIKSSFLGYPITLSAYSCKACPLRLKATKCKLKNNTDNGGTLSRLTSQKPNSGPLSIKKEHGFLGITETCLSIILVITTN